MKALLRALVITLHQRYCRQRYIPIVWSLMILTMILQVWLAALARQ